jgi:hypothetical protein
MSQGREEKWRTEDGGWKKEDGKWGIEDDCGSALVDGYNHAN